MVTAVCTGGELPPTSLCLTWLDACDRTIAADSGLRLLRKIGRKADLWIGDGDSLGPLSDWKDWYTEALQLDRAKDDSDTEAAVSAAASSDEIWLLGGAGGRMDHWWSNLRLMASQPRLTRWLTGSEEAWKLVPGAQLTVPPGTLSVFPLGAGPWKITSRGLKWPLDNVDFARWHSLSNEAGTSASLVAEAGLFLVLRPFEAAS